MPNNEVTTVTSTKSLMQMEQTYVSSISKGLVDILGDTDNYHALCGYNILQAINGLLAKSGMNHTSKGLDKESVNNAIKYCLVYGLNTDNKEVFVIIRNEKRTLGFGKDAKSYYCKVVECKPQYKGQLKILSSYGRDVKRVYPEWIVREGDEFTYATHKGIEVVAPTWTPKSVDGKVLRVVVPVEYNDGYVDYRIAERESVAVNLKAQIKQSLMSKDDNTKNRILELIKDLTLDELVKEPQVKDLINDTYTGLSAEEMIITKLVINATKRVTIDYEKALPKNAALARELSEKTYDNADVYVPSHTAETIVAGGLSEIEMCEPIEDEVTVAPNEQVTVESKPIEEITPEDNNRDTFDSLFDEIGAK